MPVENHAGTKSVDDYLSTVSEQARVTLEALRQIIRSVAPNASETISFQMPTFVHNGPLVGFAASKKHLSLHFFGYMSQEIIQLISEAGDFDLGKGCIRFSADKPLPSELVSRLVEVRMRENEARSASRK